MYFFDQFKKKKPVLIMLKSKFLLSISFNFKSKFKSI